MVEVPGTHQIFRSNYKSIDTLFPHAIRLEQDGEQEMIDAIILAAKVSGAIFQWRHIEAQVAAVFDDSSPHSLDRAITHISPYVPWYDGEVYTKNAVIRWTAAISKSRILGGSLPECGRYTAADLIPPFPTATHSSQYLGIVEGSAASPTRVLWAIIRIFQQCSAPCKRNWRHRNPQVIPSPRLVGVG